MTGAEALDSKDLYDTYATAMVLQTPWEHLSRREQEAWNKVRHDFIEDVPLTPHEELIEAIKQACRDLDSTRDDLQTARMADPEGMKDALRIAAKDIRESIDDLEAAIEAETAI